MSAIIYWQNPCKLPMSFRCIKAFMHAFSGRFSRASLEGISFKFFVCFIFNVSIGSAPKRKNFDIQSNNRVGLGCQFTSNRLSCHHIKPGGNEGHGGLCPTELLTSSVEAAMQIFLSSCRIFTISYHHWYNLDEKVEMKS